MELSLMLGLSLLLIVSTTSVVDLEDKFSSMASPSFSSLVLNTVHRGNKSANIRVKREPKLWDPVMSLPTKYHDGCGEAGACTSEATWEQDDCPFILKWKFIPPSEYMHFELIGLKFKESPVSCPARSDGELLGYIAVGFSSHDAAKENVVIIIECSVVNGTGGTPPLPLVKDVTFGWVSKDKKDYSQINETFNCIGNPDSRKIKDCDIKHIDNEDIQCSFTIKRRTIYKQTLFNFDDSDYFVNIISGCEISELKGTSQHTIVTEWQLVCDETFWASTVQAMYMFGILCGSPIFGAVSDKLGRKRAILISTIIFVISGPLVALSPNFTLVMAFRFLLAFGSPGIYGTSYVLAIEVLGPSWRGLAGNLFCLPFAVGYMVLPGVAYLLRDWKLLQLTLSTPSVLLFVTWFFLPESPRWLLRKGRVQEAEAILRQAAERNGRRKNLPVDFSDMVARIADNEKENIIDETWKTRISSVLGGYTSLLKSPKMRLRTLVIYICWASISLTYYGIALNSPNLSADRYLYTFIGGVLEIPSYFMVPPLIKYFGRKPVFSGFLLVCNAALFTSLLFEEGSTFIIASSLFGKFVIGGAYSLVYLYATELMPTLLRTYGLGTASMVGRVGSIITPYIVDLLGRDNSTYPSIVFGSVAFVAGCLSLLLPETRNRRLPESVEDVELGRV